MELSNEIEHDFPPFVRIYKDGRVHRYPGDERIPASFDETTGISSKDVIIQPEKGLYVRIFLPEVSAKPNKKLPVIVYFHGGAFFLDSPASPLYHPYCNTLASEADALIISIDYRLAPEYRLPVAYDDAWAAVRWISSSSSKNEPWISNYADFDKLYFVGDSAGANLVHNMAVRLCDEPNLLKVKGMALVHPYFWGTVPIGTENKDPEYRGRFETIWAYICPSLPSADNPLLNPFLPEMEEVMAKVPCEKVIVFVAELDDLRERGKAYYERLKSNGWKGKVELVEENGEGHVFYLFDPASKKARYLMDKMVEFIKAN